MFLAVPLAGLCTEDAAKKERIRSAVLDLCHGYYRGAQNHSFERLGVHTEQLRCDLQCEPETYV